MNLLTSRETQLELDPDDIHAEYQRLGLAARSDEQLFDLAARTVAIPKREPANSFILHAPLELLARRALLRVVAPEHREAVRERIIWVAATYTRAAEPAEPVPAHDFGSPAAARAALEQAIGEHDLETTDAAAAWLAEHATSDDVMALAPAVIDSLAAAGHGGIFFMHLGRTAANNRAALGLLRPLAREVARLPELRIEWIRNGVEASAADGTHLAEALARTPRLGLAGSDFVFPTVHQVDVEDRARKVIGATLPADAVVAGRAILRVATQSMLQDDPKFAPYGWTHCLTLPQSVLGITPWLPDPTIASAIAATYVIAFRAAEGCRDVDVDWAPERTATTLRDALDHDPATAASATYYASDAELEAVVPELAARAGSHEDAHLAKYTLACFDAAAGDPAGRRLHLAAAAYLRAWWAAPA